FTTKEGGLGLGLTLAKHAVVAHRGHIEVAVSNLGGALFRILLPAAAGPAKGTGPRVASDTPPLPMMPGERLATPDETPRPKLQPAVARKRLLWIDDDDLFLRSIKRAFADFDVTVASSAAEGESALAAIDHDLPARIFCDIGLPGKSGAELHKAIMKT